MKKTLRVFLMLVSVTVMLSFVNAKATDLFIDTLYDRSHANLVSIGSVTMGGTIYSNAISYDRGGNWDSHIRTSFHNLNEQYIKLSGYIGHIDGSAMNSAKFEFYLDGVLSSSYDLAADELPRYISLDITGVKQLQIKVHHIRPTGGSPYNGIYGFAATQLEPKISTPPPTTSPTSPSPQNTLSINEIPFTWLGKTQEELERLVGRHTETTWVSGPVFRFGNHWFNFDDPQSEQYPNGKSSVLRCNLPDIINGLTGDIVSAELNKLFGHQGRHSIDETGGDEWITYGYLTYYYKGIRVVIDCLPDDIKRNASVSLFLDNSQTPPTSTPPTSQPRLPDILPQTGQTLYPTLILAVCGVLILVLAKVLLHKK